MNRVEGENETSIFPVRTEQASSKKNLLFWLFTNLRTAKCISVGKRALKNRLGRKQTIFKVCHFRRGFCQSYR